MMEVRQEDNTHLNLRWEDHSHTFVHLLDHFRLEGLYCDASLACAGGAVYPVHKVVLSACSEFFASIFASASCHNPVVVLQDVAGEELEALLTYMYRGHVQLPRHTLQGFLKVAQSLHVKGLSPPPLSLLNDTCHTWGATNDDTPSPDASVPSTVPSHTSLHPTHPPPPYPHRDRLPLPPERDESWNKEAGSRNGAPLPQALRSQEESQKPPRKRYSPLFGGSEQFGGTFQNLVASEEEGGIKEEPREEEEEEEEMELYRADRLTIYEKDDDEEEVMKEEEEMTEEQEEGARQEEEGQDQRMLEEYGEEREGRGKDEEGRKEGRKMMVEIHPPSTPTAQTTPNGTTPSPTPSHATLSPTPSLPTLSPTPGHPALSPLPNTPPTTPSQLRRELLKPLHSRPHTAPHPHHSIPHPVIASREGDGVGAGVGVGVPREPPPLVKIPTSPPAATPPLHPALPHHYSRHLHPLHSRQSDGPDNTTTTITTTKTHHQHHHNHHHHHLLVTAQPTYRQHLVPRPPTHAAYPTLTPFKVTALMDSDTPLNLSQDHNPKHPQQRPLHIPTTQGMGAGERRVRDSKDPFLGKIMTNRKRRLRGPKSWEYLVRLLKDPTTNPSLIRWENESKGVFRLVQPGVIAQRWGRRTGKHASECLSYENFARGLRYHYATGALQPVSERSFVYKFGPKALLALGDDSREYLVPEVTSPTATVPYSTASTPTATAAASRL